jgi:hypothetical protein
MTEDKKSIARKEISRVEFDGTETIVNSIIHFDFDTEILERLGEIFEDYDYATSHNIYFNEDSDLVYIEVDSVIDEMEDRSLNDEEDNDVEKKIIVYLTPYKGFTIWV